MTRTTVRALAPGAAVLLLASCVSVDGYPVGPRCAALTGQGTGPVTAEVLPVSLAAPGDDDDGPVKVYQRETKPRYRGPDHDPYRDRRYDRRGPYGYDC